MKKKESKNTFINILTIFSVLVIGLFIYYMISNKSISLLDDTIDIAIFTILINLTKWLYITEDNTKFWSKVSIGLSILSVLLLLVKAIYSYTLIILATIIAVKNVKEVKNGSSKFALLLSIACLGLCVIFLGFTSFLAIKKAGI